VDERGSGTVEEAAGLVAQFTIRKEHVRRRARREGGGAPQARRSCKGFDAHRKSNRSHRRLGSRLYEFSALLTRTRALRETQGRQAATEIEATLAEADAWLEMSGAKSYQPFLHVERAELAHLIGDEAARQRELRDAHRLFTEMGAPIRPAEVAKGLGS
jgi:hypothetical protein